MEDVFAAADKAVEEKFGDQSGSASSDGQAAPEVKESTDQASGRQESQGSTSPQAHALLDLSKAEKFMLNGKEMTLKDLESRMMLQSDYTKKMQEIAKDREYRDNFESDLAKIERNPQLLSEFKKIYPKSYHRAAEYAAKGVSSQEQPQRQDANTQDKLIEDLVESKIGPIRNELDQYKTEAAVKQLDGIFSEMKSKFPQAEEEFVLARLQALKDQEVQIDKSKIEEVFKHFHDRDQKSKESYHLEQLNKQKTASSKAKDVPSGGGIPGQAPKKHNLSTEKGWDQLERDYENHLRTGL